jgi:hypothetical protein
MAKAMRREIKLLVIVSGAIIAGASFVAMPLRADERPLLLRALQVAPKWDGKVPWEDSLEEGWQKFETPGKFFHDWKGLARRWWLENAKVAFKGSMFLIDLLLISCLF